jgi:hypothetical protein
MVRASIARDPVTTECPSFSSSPRLFVGPIYSNNALVRYDNVVFDAN